jgi:hypothetical protein
VKIHLAKGRNDTPKVTAWCGKSMPRVQMVKQISHVTCGRCQMAFAAFLRSVPDALPLMQLVREEVSLGKPQQKF